MNNDICGWIMNFAGFFWVIAGNTECATTCLCAAMILFNLEDK